MIKLYKKTEDFWFSFPEKFRFLLVGGFNTVFAYFMWLALFYLLGKRENLALTIQYIITINVSILTMRYYVFRSHGGFLEEYIKAWGVYLLMWILNTAGMNFLIRVCEISPPWAQAIYLIGSTVLTYFLHKYFSFKEKKS